MAWIAADLYAAQTIGVGFYSSPDEGAESHALLQNIIDSIKRGKFQYNFMSSQIPRSTARTSRNQKGTGLSGKLQTNDNPKITKYK